MFWMEADCHANCWNTKKWLRGPNLVQVIVSFCGKNLHEVDEGFLTAVDSINAFLDLSTFRIFLKAISI